MAITFSKILLDKCDKKNYSKGNNRLQNSRFFFSKSVKKSNTPEGRLRREKKSRSLFSASFDCSRVLEYVKIRTVLQSREITKMWKFEK